MVNGRVTLLSKINIKPTRFLLAFFAPFFCLAKNELLSLTLKALTITWILRKDAHFSFLSASHVVFDRNQHSYLRLLHIDHAARH